jgi:hypothetical protein
MAGWAAGIMTGLTVLAGGGELWAVLGSAAAGALIGTAWLYRLENSR